MKNYTVSQALAYHDVDLKGKQFDVVKAMRDMIHTGIPMSRENIAREVGMKETSACARIKELENRGIVEVNSFTTSSSGKHVQTYKLVTKGQTDLFN